MCGIIGYYSQNPVPEHFELFYSLAKEAKIRGLHAFGVSYYEGDCIVTRKWFSFPNRDQMGPVCENGRAIWHNRYSTSGDWRVMANNQPIDIGFISVALNGVITMAPKEEWEEEFGVCCISNNDAEILARILEKGVDPGKFASSIRGSVAAVWLQGGKVWAVRNLQRPLHYFVASGAVFVVSTVDIARRGAGVEPRPVPPFRAIELGELSAGLSI